MGSDCSSAAFPLPSEDFTDPDGAKVVPSTRYSRGAIVALSMIVNWKIVSTEM